MDDNSVSKDLNVWTGQKSDKLDSQTKWKLTKKDIYVNDNDLT